MADRWNSNKYKCVHNVNIHAEAIIVLVEDEPITTLISGATVFGAMCVQHVCVGCRCCAMAVARDAFTVHQTAAVHLANPPATAATTATQFL